MSVNHFLIKKAKGIFAYCNTFKALKRQFLISDFTFKAVLYSPTFFMGPQEVYVIMCYYASETEEVKFAMKHKLAKFQKKLSLRKKIQFAL